MERQILIVSGHVQGVGFRYHVQKIAAGRNLTGFVRNLENGDVYIEIQGETGVIGEFHQAIRSSIPYATVTEIEIRPMDPIADEEAFKVKY